MSIFELGLEFMHKGGLVMWPLFLCAVTSLAVIIERSIAIKKSAHDNEQFLDDIRKHLTAGRINEALQLCERTHGPVASLIASGIQNRHLDNDSIERSMEELALRETPLLYKRLGVLDTIITLSPLLGLLGTILGMYNVFITPSALNKPVEISGHVGEALIATASGLTVAIITLPCYNYLTERVKEIISEMEVRATQLLNILANIRGTQIPDVEPATVRNAPVVTPILEGKVKQA